MKGKTFLVIGIFLILGIIFGGAFWYVHKTPKIEPKSQEASDTVTVSNEQNTHQATQDNEIDAIKDLIDGEYTFDPMDTSDWQTYRNEEAGFELKIPKDWFCGGVALDPNSKTQVACLLANQKNDYYNGSFSGNLIIIVGINNTDSATVGQLRNNLSLKKNSDEKIYQTMVDNKYAVAVTSVHYREFFSISNKWSIVGFPSADKAVLDTMILSFKLLK